MTQSQASAPSPAQERMAKARAARATKVEAVKADMAESISEDIVAQATRQRQAKEASERDAALQAAMKEAQDKGLAIVPTRGEIIGMNAERAARERQEAARRAVAPPVADMVKVRVLKAGADRISKGVHATGIGDAHYERGDEFLIAREIGVALEDRGFVEIQE